MAPKKKTNHWEWINRAANLQGLLGTPIILGLSWIGSIMSQSVPYISAFGSFGLFCTFLGFLLILATISFLLRPSKKRPNLETTEPSGWSKIFHWPGWGWVMLFVCIILGFQFIDLRPPLPPGMHPSDINLPIASYKEMGKSDIAGKTIVISAIPRPVNSPMMISHKSFEKCLIIGPAVLSFVDGNTIESCQFNYNKDPEQLLLECKSEWFVGMIGFRDCVFRQCEFKFISIAEDPSNTEQFRKQIGRP